MHNICLYVDKKRISPYAMSVYVALKEKGLNFQEKMIDLDLLEQQSLAYRNLCFSTYRSRLLYLPSDCRQQY